MAGVTTAFDSSYSALSPGMEPTPWVPRRKLSRLEALKAASTYTPREAVAVFARPVMLYSIRQFLSPSLLWSLLPLRARFGQKSRISSGPQSHNQNAPETRTNFKFQGELP
jgi:hypothetical protein